MSMRFTDRELAEAIRREFPKHTRAAFSMAKRTAETGVMLCPRSREIVREVTMQKRRPESRTNRIRKSVRLPDELAERVMAKLDGGSMQALLIRLLTEWVEAG